MKLVPVRLCDISPRVRAAAASRCARMENDPVELQNLLAAAAEPSDRTYWVPEKAARGIEFLTSGGSASVRGAGRTGVRASRETLPTDPEHREAA